MRDWGSQKAIITLAALEGMLKRFLGTLLGRRTALAAFARRHRTVVTCSISHDSACGTIISNLKHGVHKGIPKQPLHGELAQNP